MKKIFHSLILVCVFVSLVCCYVPTESEEKTELVNTTGKLAAGGVLCTNFFMKKNATVKLEVNVSDGDGVKIFLVDDDNYEKLIKNEKFSYHTRLGSEIPVISYTNSAELSVGTWNIVVVNPNLLLTQTVSRKITVQK